MTRKRILPADVYDALELVAEAFGGIGAGTDFSYSTLADHSQAPFCVWGAANYAAGHVRVNNSFELRTNDHRLEDFRVIVRALYDAGIRRFVNDHAVRSINRRKGVTTTGARVTFAEWASELEIVRGPSEKVLPPKVYDAWKALAEQHGGIGAGSYRIGGNVPMCAIGYARDVENLLGDRSARRTFIDTGINEASSDEAVKAINRRKGKFSAYTMGGVEGTVYERVSFEELAQEMNIVRGVELPAAVYDALQQSAEMWGGVGAGQFEEYDKPSSPPLCLLGHAYRVPMPVRASRALDIADVMPSANDRAVREINRRKGVKDQNARVSFRELASELRLVRGA